MILFKFQNVLDYLMSRENIMPRLNQKILEISESKASRNVVVVKLEAR